MTKIGINGFGQIGRFVFRAIAGLLGKKIEVAAVNDLVPADNLANPVKCDSTQGKITDTVKSEKFDSIRNYCERVWRAQPEQASP
jgi:glyceraldehyde 3-phosphate dehydrogenase